MSTLRDLIREEINKAEEPIYPQHVAESIARSYPEDQLREGLAEALKVLVREVIVTSRVRRNVEVPPPPTTKSWKREAIREAEVARRTALDDMYATEDGYKRLKDFSYEELVALADECRRQAEANMAQATRLEKVAEMMKAANAKTVADVASEALPLWD